MLVPVHSVVRDLVCKGSSLDKFTSPLIYCDTCGMYDEVPRDVGASSQNMTSPRNNRKHHLAFCNAHLYRYPTRNTRSGATADHSLGGEVTFAESAQSTLELLALDFVAPHPLCVLLQLLLHAHLKTRRKYHKSKRKGRVEGRAEGTGREPRRKEAREIVMAWGKWADCLRLCW